MFSDKYLYILDNNNGRHSSEVTEVKGYAFSWCFLSNVIQHEHQALWFGGAIGYSIRSNLLPIRDILNLYHCIKNVMETVSLETVFCIFFI